MEFLILSWRQINIDGLTRLRQSSQLNCLTRSSSCRYIRWSCNLFWRSHAIIQTWRHLSHNNLARGERISGSVALLWEGSGKVKVLLPSMTFEASLKQSNLQKANPKSWDRERERQFTWGWLVALPVGESWSVVWQTITFWCLTITHRTDAADVCKIHMMVARWRQGTSIFIIITTKQAGSRIRQQRKVYAKINNEKIQKKRRKKMQKFVNFQFR